MTLPLDADLLAAPPVADPGPFAAAHLADPDRRLRQQAALSAFGLHALRTTDLDELLRAATEHCAHGLSVSLCKILRPDPGTGELLLHAGTGWKPGTVGQATVGADLASPAGYALRTGAPVISNHLEHEDRFRTPALMAEHDVRRAVNVLITAHRQPWGVLEADSPDPGAFEPEDVAFLQGLANLLGVAVERHDAERRLQEAAERHRLLAGEASHRVKNSLAMVASLLRLQARSGASPETAAALREAENRIGTIATAHDQLWRSDTVGEIALNDFLQELCARLRRQAEGARISCDAAPLALPAERAIAAGLLVTELVTDSMKHAAPGAAVDLALVLDAGDDFFTLSIADRTPRAPASASDPAHPELGRRMIDSLARQLRATLSSRADAAGGTIHLSAPR
ncbi:MAG: GAF domain-containing protein [Gluconacetobacter diazotrophicus]|nr:GAF domain-containing protein [Gluconacetobacter diazotrophicus]